LKNIDRGSREAYRNLCNLDQSSFKSYNKLRFIFAQIYAGKLHSYLLHLNDRHGPLNLTINPPKIYGAIPYFFVPPESSIAVYKYFDWSNCGIELKIKMGKILNH